jgi:cell division protein FtsW
MGQQSTRITQPSRVVKNKEAANRPLRLKIDVVFLLVTITLVVFGIVMVYSASYGISFYVSDTQSPNEMFVRQLMWLGVGLVGMGFLTWLDYRKWQKLGIWVMLGTILALLAVLLIGDTSEEYTRDLSSGSYQPSELAKLMIIIYLSVWMYSKRDYLDNIQFGLIPLAAILGVVSGLIFLQPDVSAAGTIIMLGGVMFYLAGGDMRQILILLFITVMVGLLVILVYKTGNERVASFVTGLKDPLESSDHVQRALSAFANGGWFGVGLGKGSIKLTILPVPHTDSIFAVVGEEFGVFGATIVVCLFGVFLWRGLVIARRAPDGLGTLLAAGIPMWIAMEAFMNMLALTGLMPFAGNPLPFFSLGGSSLVFTLAGVGIVLNISRQSEQKKLEEERRTFGALIDVRGWNRRRRVPRPSSSRSARR